jgi:hypothetical protein
VVSREPYAPVQVPGKILPYLLRSLIDARGIGKTVEELLAGWPKVRGANPKKLSVKRQIRALNSELEPLYAECNLNAGVDKTAYVLEDLELPADPPLAIDQNAATS